MQGRYFLSILCIVLFIPLPCSAGKKSKPVLLVSRPIDAGAVEKESKYQWLIALIDRQVRFKLEPVVGLSTVDETALSAVLPALYDYRTLLDEKAFRAVAPKVGATHLLVQKFEVLQHEKTVNYYAELITPPGRRIVAQTEKDIPFDRVSGGIDSCMGILLTQLGIRLSSDADRFLHLPVTGASFRSIRGLGELFLKEHDTAFSRKTLGNEYEKIIKKDPFMLLANYAGGLLFFRMKEYDKAARYLKELLDLSPNQTSLYLTLAQSYRFGGNYNEALQVALLCEQSRLKTVPYLLEKALALEGLRQESMAFAVHQQILMLEPNQPVSLLFMAHTRNNERKYAEGKSFAEKLLEYDRDNALGHYELGRAYFNLGDYPKAQKALASAERFQPDDPSIQELLGDLSMVNRQFEKANGHYQRASTIRPRELDLFLKTAAALEAAGKKAEALTLCYGIADRFPSKTQLRRQIGMLEYANGMLDSACRSLTMYLATKPDDGEVLRLLGDAYLQKKIYRKAQDYFKKAIPLINDKITCRLSLADIELRQKNHQTAVRLLRGIIAEKPIREAHRMMGDALLFTGKKNDALKEYRTERELHGDNASLQEKIALLHYELGFYIPAKKEFEHLVRLSPKHAGAHYYLALLALRSGNPAAAGAFLSNAEELGKGTVEIYYEAGTLFSEKKAHENAIKAFTRCLALSPDHEPALRDLADVSLAVGNDTAAAAINVRLFNKNNKAYASRLAEAGHLYLKHNRESSAAAAYRRFLDKGFSDFSVNAGYASILYQKKEYKKVIPLLENLSGDFARQERNLLMLADAYCQTGQYAKALPWLAKLRQITTANPLEARLSAQASEKTGDTVTAIAMYVRLLSFPPDARHTEEAYHLGTLYEAKKLVENAITRYEKNLTESPDDLRSHERLGRIYLQRNDLPNARRVLETALSFPHVTAEIQKMLAQTYTASNNMSKAAGLYAIYLSRVKDDHAAWKELALIYYSQNKFTEAIKPLKQVTALQPNDFDGWYKLGAAFVAIENFTAAIAPLGRARALNPKSIPAIELLARCYRRNKETSTLTNLLREWIAVDPRRYDIKMEIGSILLDEKEIDEAIVMLNQAVRFIPSEAKPHLLLAKAYELQENDSLRFAHLSEALKFGSGDWETHFQLARYYLAKKRENDAERHLKQVVAINPAFARAHFEYGSLLNARGDFAAADTQFRLAVETESGNALFRSMLAYTECMTGNARAAITQISDPIITNSTDPQVFYWAGNTYKQCSRKEDARESYQKALDLDNSCAVCLESLGDLFMEGLHFKEAANHYFKAWEKGGYNAKRVYKLGNALLYDRKYTEAKDFFETILNKDNDHDDAKYRLAVAYCELGQIHKARELIATFHGTGTPWMQLAQGKIYEKEGNYDAAFVAYTIAKKINADHPEVAYGLGTIFMQRKEYDSAVIYLSSASAADTLNMQAMMHLGAVFEHLGDPAAATQYYLEVDKKYPWFPEVQLRIARIKSAQKAHETALRYLKRGIDYQPSDTSLYLMAGMENAILDNNKEALEYFKQALKKGKGKPIEAFRHIGNIYYDKLADMKKAKDYYKKYLKAGGSTPEVAERLAGI
ncbi:MAG: tetratricopeptide repeat protein [Chitinispirillaceae bacterium]|nr:tetratricopeptide repeat protein [Chitinispirillaceae bacterium]